MVKNICDNVSLRDQEGKQLEVTGECVLMFSSSGFTISATTCDSQNSIFCPPSVLVCFL